MENVDKKVEKEIKKLTTAEILGRRDDFRKRSGLTQELFIPELGYSVVFRKPTSEECRISFGMDDDISDLYILSECMTEPNLKDPELLKEFGCIDSPLDIVEKIFSAGEVYNIALAIMKFAGYTSKYDPVNELKNR